MCCTLGFTWVRIRVLHARESVYYYCRVLNASHCLVCKVLASYGIPSVGYIRKTKAAVVSKHCNIRFTWLVKSIYYRILYANKWDKSSILKISNLSYSYASWWWSTSLVYVRTSIPIHSRWHSIVITAKDIERTTTESFTPCNTMYTCYTTKRTW